MSAEPYVLCGKGSRAANQDRAVAYTGSGCGLYFVADGMGGHYDGAMASSTVQNALCAWWQTAMTAPPAPEQAVPQLRAVVEECSVQIRRRTPPGQVCGCTLVLLWLTRSGYALLNIGDSRCYRVRHRLLRTEFFPLTSDDVLHAPGSPDDGKLLRAIGVHPDCNMQVRTGAAEPGTLFALCTDGVHRYCPEPTLRRCLTAARRTGLPDAAAAIEGVLLGGGAPDNYSLVLVQPW